MSLLDSEVCPTHAAFLSQAGITSAAVLAALGAAYGTAKSGSTIAMIGSNKPDIIVNSLLPVVMASVLSLYGLVIAVYISLILPGTRPVSLFSAALHLGAGLTVGLACLAAGFAIGQVGDVGVRAYAKQPRFLTGFVLLLVFGEVLGIYGFICAGFLVNKSGDYLFC